MVSWKNKDLVKFGWNKAKENFWPLVSFVFIVYVAGALADEIHIGFLVNILTSFVMTSVFLRIAKGEKFDFKKIFQDLSGPKILHYLIATIIMAVFVVLGFALLIVPGIIVATMLVFTTYVLIEERKDMPWKSTKFWQAIKTSYHMTKGHKWKIFTLFLVLLGINILGFLALVVGLLFTIPLSGIAMATLYDKLKNHKDNHVGSNIIEATPSEQAS